MKILMLSETDMSQVISMCEVIETDKEALRLYSTGNSDTPLRLNLEIPEHNGQSLYMPGYAAEIAALGIKMVSVYPDNIAKGLPSVPATMVLLDPVTGQVCAVMNGTYLTRLRTGAASGAATDLLARGDSAVFLLIGTGGQAVTQLQAVLEVRPIRRVYVADLDFQRAGAFAQAMSDRFRGMFPATVEAVQNPNAVVAEADIITTVTTSKTPVFDGNLIKPGVHLNAVGSYTPQMQELPETALQKAQLIYVDTCEGVIHESGDFINPLKAGRFTLDRLTGELGELVAGKTPGRSRPDEISLFETTGSAILDVAVAKKIYDNAVKQGVGTYIEL